MEITERTIATAREKGVERFDDVLLVGGMTITPAIAQTLKERFGLDARLQDPHLAVAKGAALFALMKKVKVSMPGDEADAARPRAPRRRWPTSSGSASSRSRTWRPSTWRRSCRAPSGSRSSTARTPCSRSTRNRAREYISHLLTANTRLPADTGPQTFRTVADNQREVKLEVWEQAGSIASEELEHNTHIGEGILADLPRRPAGAPFQVVFHMTETGLLKVHGWEADSGREVRFEIQIGGLDEAEVQKATAAVARYEVSG